MTRILFYILILIPISTSAQSDNFEHVDNYVLAQRFSDDISISELTTRLTEPFDTDILKTRAIYDWIAKNIDYDFQGYKNNFWTNYPSDSAILNDTYKFRKGVCSGYAHLFKYMLELCSIESEVISGHSRTGLDNFFLFKSNHDWNTVKINKEWKLFDVTWARESNDTIIDYFWFNTDPDIFILWHFPEDNSWLLTDKAFSIEDFYNFPVYSKLFYQVDFASYFSYKGYFVTSNDTVRIDLKPNFDCIILSELYDLEAQKWETPDLIDETKESGYCYILIKNKGKYILKLSAARNLEDDFVIYENLILYSIENK